MKTLVLLVLLCIILPLDAKQRFTQEGVNISLIHSSNQSGSDLRSQSVSADLTGHTLTIEFNEDIGKAHISITNNYGVHIESETVYSTPDCFIFTIRDTGIYRIEIIASNGEQYSGNFRIEN